MRKVETYEDVVVVVVAGGKSRKCVAEIDDDDDEGIGDREVGAVVGDCDCEWKARGAYNI